MINEKKYDTSSSYPTDKSFPSDLRAPVKSTQHGGSLGLCMTGQTHLSRSRQRDLARRQNKTCPFKLFFLKEKMFRILVLRFQSVWVFVTTEHPHILVQSNSNSLPENLTHIPHFHPLPAIQEKPNAIHYFILLCKI